MELLAHYIIWVELLGGIFMYRQQFDPSVFKGQFTILLLIFNLYVLICTCVWWISKNILKTAFVYCFTLICDVFTVLHCFTGYYFVKILSFLCTYLQNFNLFVFDLWGHCVSNDGVKRLMFNVLFFNTNDLFSSRKQWRRETFYFGKVLQTEEAILYYPRH